MDECFELWFHDCLHAGARFSLPPAGRGQGAKQKGLCADLPVTEPVVVTECLVGYLVEVHCFGRVIRRSGNNLLRSPT